MPSTCFYSVFIKKINKKACEIEKSLIYRCCSLKVEPSKLKVAANRSPNTAFPLGIFHAVAPGRKFPPGIFTPVRRHANFRSEFSTPTQRDAKFLPEFSTPAQRDANFRSEFVTPAQRYAKFRSESIVPAQRRTIFLSEISLRVDGCSVLSAAFESYKESFSKKIEPKNIFV